MLVAPVTVLQCYSVTAEMLVAPVTAAFFCLSLLPSSSSIEIANYASWSFAPEVLGVRQIFVLRFRFRFGRLCFLRDFLAFIASVMQLEGRPPMPPWYPWQGHSCC